MGVSNYLNLPDHDDPPREDKWFLNQLTSPSLSALKIFDFIQQQAPRLPIKTIRLLLSPSVVELRAEPRLLSVTPTRAGRAAFQQPALGWRDDANTNPDDMTFLYFAGHGMQRGSDDGVLLLEDFLAPGPPLAKCFEIGDIRDGMAPTNSFPNIAMTQFYFVDACLAREETLVNSRIRRFRTCSAAELGGVDRRATPTMFSTSMAGSPWDETASQPFCRGAGTRLAARRGRSDGSGGSSVWPVTSVTIARALELYYKKNKLGGSKAAGA